MPKDNQAIIKNWRLYVRKSWYSAISNACVLRVGPHSRQENAVLNEKGKMDVYKHSKRFPTSAGLVNKSPKIEDIPVLPRARALSGR